MFQPARPYTLLVAHTGSSVAPATNYLDNCALPIFLIV